MKFFRYGFNNIIINFCYFPQMMSFKFIFWVLIASYSLPHLFISLILISDETQNFRYSYIRIALFIQHIYFISFIYGKVFITHNDFRVFVVIDILHEVSMSFLFRSNLEFNFTTYIIIRLIKQRFLTKIYQICIENRVNMSIFQVYI